MEEEPTAWRRESRGREEAGARGRADVSGPARKLRPDGQHVTLLPSFPRANGRA